MEKDTDMDKDKDADTDMDMKLEYCCYMTTPYGVIVPIALYGLLVRRQSAAINL
jgi:hypothetical protein